MKMRLRKSVLFLLIITVLAPIVLYTNTLGTNFTSPSSRNEYLQQVSIFSSNELFQESSKVPKEPFRVVYSENSTQYHLNYSDILVQENSRITRQLTEESFSTGDGNKKAVDNNPILQVTETAHEAGAALESSKEDELIRENGSEGVNKSQIPEDISGNSSGGEEIKYEKQSSRRSTKDSAREQGKTTTEKENEPTVLLDTHVRHLKDQLIRARVYLSLAATRSNPQFIRELRLRVKEVLRALGEATKDSELPKNAKDKLKAMEQTLAKGKQIQDDCASVVKKLRAMLHSAEEQLQAHKKQTLFLTQLTAKTLPKGLHCLPLRLSVEYFMLNSSQRRFPHEEKLVDSKLYHYALFSDNVLAAAVVVNSTVTHAKDPSKHVFHIVTDRLNYAAMKMWFLANPPGKAAIQVQNVEEFTWLNSSYSPVLKQLGSASMIDYYFKGRNVESDPNLKFRNPKYLSIMNHLRFYLPEIFPKLEKVLFLDDDVVVRKDLTALWSLDLNGKVIGVVETCRQEFHRFDRYLNFSNPLISENFDPHACGWAFGMNIFDLKEWRKQNITDVYHRWQNLNHERLLWKLGTLPPGLITFWNHTYTLNKSWHVLGLGYNPNVPQKEIERAAVIHYNGNLKPWLEIGISKLRKYWSSYVDYDQVFLRECNISP